MGGKERRVGSAPSRPGSDARAERAGQAEERLADRLARSREIIADAREVLRAGGGPKARSPGKST